ncbi:hypothetical protein [Alkalilimnicola sp. S0819]|uniref:hypothetical protein n=1 Tax=Alkalilimnicola sp. S0819 TaxID=2613922 RepID=UPI001262147F|nr:hypothetical protein [Alkalilimnicola sp. S0819]KAB7619750.1 hypothetical protein F3N43_12815 [Alkalilimnicola sp. S0819]MPQ17514.1 hypothetical protein [Alkalilimnicola sp. S0819]
MISRPAIKFGILMLAFLGAASISSNSAVMALGLPNAPWVVFSAAFVVAMMGFGFSWRYMAMLIAAVLAANLPPESTLAMGYERDYALAVLLALLITPYIAELLE